ncbi:porin family protein [Nostoc sp. 3335mG]|nr:porin family protein [Nostoc sp. 3335mG]
MNRSAIALSALFLLTSVAGAADLGWSGGGAATSPMYSSTSAADWNGFYAGVNGGYLWGTTTTSPAIGVNQNNSSGWTAGAQAGFNADMGGLVIGAEGDLQWANLAYSEPAGAPGTFEAKLDLFGTIRARAGGTLGQVMPYVTGGVAFGRGSANTVSGGVTTSQSATHMGWTAGVGIEAKATDQLSVKAEYLYVDLGSQNYTGLPVGNRDIGHRFSVIRAGVNYSF